jgi:MazG family protein
MSDTHGLSPIERLRRIMARLRDPDGGCPWDLEQNFATIAPHTIEEAYEVADAIAADDMAALSDELGDLLFQVVYHAQMAAERGAFDFDDVARAIADKMVRRHPHVFGDTEIATAAAQTRAWKEHKAEERRRRALAEQDAHSALDGVTVGLPALTRALKLQKRAARVGFDWPSAADVLHKIDEEVIEVKREMGGRPERIGDEIGDLLFSVVNLARHLEIDPEGALRQANRKFEHRFRAMEKRLGATGHPVGTASLDEMEVAWQAVKAGEKL